MSDPFAQHKICLEMAQRQGEEVAHFKVRYLLECQRRELLKVKLVELATNLRDRGFPIAAEELLDIIAAELP